jgi:hypothetical protein
VAYKVAESTLVGSGAITLTANFALYSTPATIAAKSVTATVNLISPTLSSTVKQICFIFGYIFHILILEKQIASIPSVTTYIDPTPVPIYGTFNITVTVDFPTVFESYLQVDVIPDISTLDGLPQIKACSVVIYQSGENLGCPKCMNQGTTNPYSQNSSIFTTYDSLQWSVGSVLNYGLRTKSSYLPTVNQMKYNNHNNTLLMYKNINKHIPKKFFNNWSSIKP